MKSRWALCFALLGLGLGTPAKVWADPGTSAGRTNSQQGKLADAKKDILKLAKLDLKPSTEFTKDMQTDPGFSTVFFDKKKLKGYMEVQGRQLKKPFLLATSIAGGTRFTGWQWNDALVYWKRHDKRLLLIEKNVRYRAKKDSPLEASIERTYTDQLLLDLPIVARSRRGYLIDMNELFAAKAGKFFGRAGAGLDSSLAVFSKLKAFEKNTEIAVTMPERGGGSFITLHYSLRSLDTTSFKPRKADDRIGYFLTAATDFENRSFDDNRTLRFINRWNLEKLDPKLELSPVKKPIVFYLEKTIPVPYRRYVAEGILEWNKAFRKLGFLDAVQVRQQTKDNEFKDYDPEDASYNFFRWITSRQAFAMGPSRVNPMTGEILDADIIFDDDMINSALDDYETLLKEMKASKDSKVFKSLREVQSFLQHGRILRPSNDNPLALGRVMPKLQGRDVSSFEKAVYEEMTRRMALNQQRVCMFGFHKRHELSFARLATGKMSKLPLDFLGQSVKETVMHEVGHTLGLRHNFAASTWLPLKTINSASKPVATTGSVMDYNPVNVAAPGQKQGRFQSGTLGPYDYWAIEYGYTPKSQHKDLQAIAKRVADDGLVFATDEDTMGPDPYVNRWDLGKDPLNFSKDRVAMAKKLLTELEKRALTEGARYYRLRRAFGSVLYEHLRAGTLASRFIGGVRFYRDHVGDPGKRNPTEYVPGGKQKEALAFILDEICGADAMTFSPDLLRKLGANHWNGASAVPLHDRILMIQERTLSRVFSSSALERLLDAEMNASEKDEVLTMPELFETCTASIHSELASTVKGPYSNRKPLISSVRRNLQRTFIGMLIDMALDTSSGASQAAKTTAWYQLKKLQAQLAKFVKDYSKKLDTYSLAHLEESQTRIQKALDAAYQMGGGGGGGDTYYFVLGKDGKLKAHKVKASKD